MMKKTLIVAFALVGFNAVAADGATDPTMASLVNMAASMNELALACNHMSPSAVAAGKDKQRAAAVSEMNISAADYDKLYAAAEDGFKKKWAGVPAAQQQKTCSQMKALSGS